MTRFSGALRVLETATGTDWWYTTDESDYWYLISPRVEPDAEVPMIVAGPFGDMLTTGHATPTAVDAAGGWAVWAFTNGMIHPAHGKHREWVGAGGRGLGTEELPLAVVEAQRWLAGEATDA